MGKSFRNIKLNDNVLNVDGVDYILDGTASVSDTTNSSFKVLDCVDNGDETITLTVNGNSITVNKYQQDKPYLTFSSPNAFTLSISNNTKYWDGTLEYSTDKTNWSTWAGTSAISSSQIGTTKYLYLRGTGNTYITGTNASATNGVWIFSDNNITISGKISKLLDYSTTPTTIGDRAFANLFRRTGSGFTTPDIVDTSNLSIDIVGTASCLAMFQSQTLLTKAPYLPCTTTYYMSYCQMFTDCSSLSTIHPFSVDTISNGNSGTSSVQGCFTRMFRNTAITDASGITIGSSSTPLTDNACCSYMFQGCSSLLYPPSLPSTSVPRACYYGMFNTCSSLTSAPSLNINEITGTISGTYGHFSFMFDHCSSITSASNVHLNMPTIPNYCCTSMFQYCTSLITPPTISATTVEGATTTQVANGGGCSYMFYNCTSLTTTPSLPATTLGMRCYIQMFYGCSNLTSIPELPATTLPYMCYYEMFRYCSKIKLSTTQTGEYQNAYRIPTSGTGTGESATAIGNMFLNTGGTFTGTPDINTTYYTSNTIVSAN